MIAMVHRILKFSGAYAKRIRLAYLFAFLKAVVANVPLMIAIFLIDILMQKKANIGIVIYTTIGMLCCLLLQAIFQNFADRLQSGTGYQVFAEKRLELGHHLRHLPMGYFNAGNMGKISSVLSADMVFIEEQAMMIVADVVSSIFAQIILTFFLFTLHPFLGYTALIVEIIAVIAAQPMIRGAFKNSELRQKSIEDLTTSVLEYTDGLGVIKSYNLMGFGAADLRKSFKKMKDMNLEFEENHAPKERNMLIIYGFGKAVLLAVNFYLLQSGGVSTSMFIGVLLFLFNIFTPLRQLYQKSVLLTIMQVSLNRIEEIFKEVELDDSGTDTLKENAEKEIEFKNVSFAYGGEEVLHEISFCISKGQMIALVGKSGSGKTTVANLLARFWDIQSGEIYLRGKNIKRIPISVLMDQISVVFQKVYLFEDTIKNNIMMGKPEATEEEMIEAAKKACCYDFIMRLPYGFNTIIGEGGASLSGGEAQRISIARAILKDASIIILDEATASVDVDNEREIQQAMSRLCYGKTILVIAHHLKTIRDADQILVLEKGKIQERGNHKELMHLKGIYYHMNMVDEGMEGWKEMEGKINGRNKL